MSSLADIPELVGFFSYSREDDEDSHGSLSALRDRIQRELRGQLGRTMKTFRLWQDKEAIAPGTLWESEIKNAVGQAVFFVPIITPTVVRSPYCKFELESFLTREAELGRRDLVFPILYIRVPELEERASLGDPVLSIIAKRQYLDWREFRHRDVNSADIKTEIERFCANICDALRRTWLSPDEQQRQVTAASRRHETETRQMAAAAIAVPVAAERSRGANGAGAAPEPARFAPSVSRWPTTRALAIGGLLAIAAALIAAAITARMMTAGVAPTALVAPAPNTPASAAPSAPAPPQTTAVAPPADTAPAASPASPVQGVAAPSLPAAEPGPPSSTAVTPPPENPAPSPPPIRTGPSHRPYRY